MNSEEIKPVAVKECSDCWKRLKYHSRPRYCGYGYCSGSTRVHVYKKEINSYRTQILKGDLGLRNTTKTKDPKDVRATKYTISCARKLLKMFEARGLIERDVL